jgi:hypothetical protein
MSDTMQATSETANHRATTPDAQDNNVEMEDVSRADSVPVQETKTADVADKGSDDDSEEEEEYEIEDILGHELKNVSINEFPLFRHIAHRSAMPLPFRSCVRRVNIDVCTLSSFSVQIETELTSFSF